MIVETKVLGSRKRPYEPWEIDFNFDTSMSSSMSLKDFIRRMVLQEVEAFKLRQEERKLVRVLSKEDIAKASEKGKIDMGGRELDQDVDVEEAIDTALLAFEDGFYYVFIDKEQVEALDTQIDIRPDTHVLFLRLVPLVGG